MDIENQIKEYISTLPEPKQTEIQELNRIILELNPRCKLWFLDGKNSENKVVSNPNIGYGTHIIQYTDGSSKEFYRIGISANTTGISVYIMGHTDKTFLVKTYGEKIGKASVSGYCIKFKTLKHINIEVLLEAIQNGFELPN